MRTVTTCWPQVLFRGLAPLVPEDGGHYSGFTHNVGRSGDCGPAQGAQAAPVWARTRSPFCDLNLAPWHVLGKPLAGASEARPDTKQATFLLSLQTSGPAPVPIYPYVEMAWPRAQRPGIRRLCPHLIPTRHVCSGRLGEYAFEHSVLLWDLGTSFAPVCYRDARHACWMVGVISMPSDLLSYWRYAL